MHVPDGFLNLPTSLATGAAAAVVIGVALRGAARELDDRSAPMGGLVATFVFAGQMMNFPVGAGTSGHLLGGALAATLVGPWMGILCVSVVIIVQALFMADGGITALGSNILLMAVLTVVVATGVNRLLLMALPRRAGVVAPVAGVSAFVSVVTAAAAFSMLFVVGGNSAVEPSLLFKAMVGWHVLIGLGEGVITALIVGGVVALRPDLVWAARPVLSNRTLELRNEVAR
ncbi:MAG: energy-coupling factor ABC transporter permease [Nocardioides sp.]